LPACGRGVTVPTSTKPKPRPNQAGTSTCPLSIPAASPTGLGNRSPHRVCESASRARGRRARRDHVQSDAPATVCAASGGSRNRRGRSRRYTRAHHTPQLPAAPTPRTMRPLDPPSKDAREAPARAAPPQGTQDLLFEAARRLRRCEAALARVFEERGFAEVIPPSIEAAEVFAESAGGAADALRAVDRHGHLLALRADFTAQVARIAATRLSGISPLRLYYRGSVVRESAAGSGVPRERLQAGCELVGEAGPEADAEMLAAAAASPLALGIAPGAGPRRVLGPAAAHRRARAGTGAEPGSGAGGRPGRGPRPGLLHRARLQPVRGGRAAGGRGRRAVRHPPRSVRRSEARRRVLPR